MLSLYVDSAKNAAAGIPDMFLGRIETKDEILLNILNQRGYGYRQYEQTEQLEQSKESDVIGIGNQNEPLNGSQPRNDERGSRENSNLRNAGRRAEQEIEPTGTNKYGKDSDRLEQNNQRFNEELQQFKDGQLKSGQLHLGKPNELLEGCGLNAEEITLSAKTLKEHLNKHGITADEIKDLPKAINNPFMVYEWGTKAKSTIIITNITRTNDEKITVAVKVERNGKSLEVNEIASIHGKDGGRFISDMLNAKEGGLEEALKYVQENKKEVLDWLGMDAPKASASLTNQELNSIAKIIQNFELPKKDTTKKKKTLQFSREEGRRNETNSYESSLPQTLQAKRAEREAKGRAYSKRRIEHAVKDLKLNLNNINVVNGIGEIPASEKAALEAVRNGDRVRGWYNIQTNNVYLYAPNIGTVTEAKSVILHEGVSHNGLRGMLGKKNFDQLCDKVFAAMPDTEKRRFIAYNLNRDNLTDLEYIAELSPKSVRAAADEYMAHIAENGVERSVFDKIKQAIVEVLRKIGFNIEFSDNDIKKLLNESYHSLKKNRNNNYPLLNIEQVNYKFNKELEEQIKGTLPKGHVYQLGVPNNVLVSAGINCFPIELSADRLQVKSEQTNHQFDISDIKNLPQAINNPIAVFDSRTQKGSKVILTELKSNDNNFVVVMRVRTSPNNSSIEINDIRSLYPKDNKGGIVEWINDGLLKYANKEKLIDFLTQSTNLIGGKKIDNYAAKIVENFEDPNLLNKKNTRFSISKREMDEIKAKAQVNGTFMKAPNGKKTKLTERQWLQVRTKAFKDWFGDWELGGLRDYLLSDNVVSKLTGNEFEKDGTPLTEKVTEYYQKEYGGKVTRKDFGEVMLDRRSVKDSLSHGIGRLKSAAFAAVPNIITDGRLIDTQSEWKGRNQDSFTFAAPVQIGDKNYVGIVIVTRGNETGTNRFYLHEVILQENLLNDSKTDTKAENHSGDIAKVLQNIVTAKSFSKILDENGEPMVVYHGTQRSPDKYDAASDSWILLTRKELKELPWSIFELHSEGAFFAEDKELAERYAKRENVTYKPYIFECFLNIRNPEYINAGEESKTLNPGENTGWRGADNELYLRRRRFGNGVEVRNDAIAKGYDGFVLANHSWEDTLEDYHQIVAFNPNQIKSATDNDGSFDKGNDDIRFSISEKTEADFLNEALQKVMAKDKFPHNFTIDEDTIRDTEYSAEMDANLLIDGKPSNLHITIFDTLFGARGLYNPVSMVKYYPIDNEKWSWELAYWLGYDFNNKNKNKGYANVGDESSSVYFSSMKGALNFNNFVNEKLGIRTAEDFFGEVERIAKSDIDLSKEDRLNIVKDYFDILPELPYEVTLTVREVFNNAFENREKGEILFSKGGTHVIELGDNTLIGLHNIGSDKLRKAIKSGGLANPSVAVIDIATQNHEDYGEISLILPKNMIDKKSGRNAGTYLGDAWTPTYPQVKKSLTQKGIETISTIAEQYSNGNNEIENRLRNRITDYVEGNNGRLHYLFLAMTGRNPELSTYKPQYPQEAYNKLKDLIEGGIINKSSKNLTKEESDRIFNVMLENHLSKIDLGKYSEKERNAIIEFYKKDKFDNEGKLHFGIWNNFLYNLMQDNSKKGTIDFSDTESNASRRVYEEGLRHEYNEWINNLLSDEDIKEELFVGYTPSGKRKYVPNTPENASRIMNRQNEVNANDNTGFGATKSVLLKKVGTLKAIRDNKYRLQSSEEVDKATEDLSDRLFNIVKRIADMQKVSDNSFINIDIAEARLQEAITKRNPVNYLNSEYGYYLEPNGDLAQEIRDFIKDVNELPVKYFETKFRRPVYLNEFAAAVVPQDLPQDLKDGLQQSGLPMYEYDDKIEGSRREATLKATEDKGIRFSVSHPIRRYILHEMDEIKDKAIANGTFKKAPNGKKTKLTERQWLQVRTKAFKDWFGDWEKAAKAKAIRGLKAITVIRNNFTKEEVKERYGNIGEVTNKNDNRKVTFYKGVFGKMYKDGGLFAQIVPQLKGLFENSVLAYSETDNLAGTTKANGTLHKEHRNISSYDNYVAKAKIDGKEYYVRFTVQNETDGRRGNHSLMVTNVSLYDNTVNVASASAKLGERLDIDSITDAKLQQFFENARQSEENSSKVVDENGEPMVVYHRTNAEFTEFDSNYNGTSNDAGWLGDGFYFYGVESEGYGYGKNKMAVFLNIREPYYATYEENNRLAEANDREVSVAFREDVEDEGYDGVYYNGDLREEYVAFNPNQIKSATDNIGMFSKEDDDIRYSIAGERGARSLDEAEETTIRIDNLTIARDMENEGKSAKEIRLATGWERGADKKWRYEIPDFTFKPNIKIKRETYKLDRLIDAPELFKAYPELKNMPVHYIDMMEDVLGGYIPARNCIDLNILHNTDLRRSDKRKNEDKIAALVKQHPTLQEYIKAMDNLFSDSYDAEKAIRECEEIEQRLSGTPEYKEYRKLQMDNEYVEECIPINKDTLIHEIQHAIQHIEGFAQGNSVAAIQRAEEANAKVRERVEELANRFGYEGWIRKGLSDSERSRVLELLKNNKNFALTHVFAESLPQKHAEFLISELDRANNAINYNSVSVKGSNPKLSNGLKAEEIYRRTAGEVEARNVSTRMKLSEAERRERLLVDTEDVSREDNIFIGRGLNAIAEKSERYQTQALEETNRRFNEELQQQKEGTLPKEHTYQLGQPSAILRSVGIPNLPIELKASRLSSKSKQENHPFDLEDVKDLVKALQKPVAIFEYGDRAKAQNIIVEINKNDKNFLVGLSLNPKNLQINDVRGIFPKDSAEWLNWIAQDKALYLDKEKIQTLITQQRINLAEVGYLDLDLVAKVVKNFDNSEHSVRNFDTDIRFSKINGSELPKASKRAVFGVVESDSRLSQLQREEAVIRISMRKSTDSEEIMTLAAQLYSNQIEQKREAQKGKNLLERAKTAAANSQFGTRVVELFGDRDIHLKRLQDQIKAMGGKVRESEDAWNNLNHSASRSMHQMQRYDKDYMQPLEQSMREAIKVLEKKIKEKEFPNLTLILDKRKPTSKGIETVHTTERVTPEKALNLYLMAKDMIEAKELNLVNRGREGFIKDVNLSPEAFVSMVENALGIKSINEINGLKKQATDKILDLQVEYGFLNRDKAEEYKKRKHYVPQRGWEELDTEAAETAGTAGTSVYNDAMKKAKGRTSLAATTPLAYISNIASSTILHGERNKGKIAALNLIMNNADIAKRLGISLNRAYFVPIYDDNLQLDSYEIRNKKPMGDINYHYKRIQKDDVFGDRGKKMSAMEKYIAGKGNRKVFVNVNGIDYEMEFSNTSIANSLNGEYMPALRKIMQTKAYRSYVSLNRNYTQLMTSLNPAFAVSNFLRDVGFKQASNAIEGNIGMGFAKLAMVQPTVWRYYTTGKIFDTEEANKEFNAELQAFEKNSLKRGILHLGRTNSLLRACGLNDSEITLQAKTLKEHLEKHNFSIEEIKDLPAAILNPFMVYEWGTKAKSTIVITNITRSNGNKIAVAVKLERNGESLEVNEIASIHGKDGSRFVSDMLKEGEHNIENSLKYVQDNKKEVLDWLGLVPPKGTASLSTAELQIAKVIQNFDNPKIPAEEKYARYFEEFLREGGLTGWAFMQTPEQLQAEISKRLNQSEAGKVAKKVGLAIPNAIKGLTEIFETTTRFAQYVGMREKGYSVFGSVTAAKNVTTNFDRKGLLSPFIGGFYGFFNATIQGTRRLGSVLWNNKRNAGIATAAFAALGMAATLLNPDDDDKEQYLSEFDRMSNFYWLFNGISGKIPLPHGLRCFWALGVQLGLAMQGKKDFGEAFSDACHYALSDLFPINPVPIEYTENGLETAKWDEIVRDFVPTLAMPIYDVANNITFTGGRVHPESYNKNKPQWQQGKSDVADWAVWLSKKIFELGGGNINANSVIDPLTGEKVGNIFDVNPSSIEHLATSWAAGVGKIGFDIDKTIKKGRVAYFPIANRFVSLYNKEQRANAAGWDLKAILDNYEAQYRAMQEIERTAKAEHRRLTKEEQAVYDSLKKKQRGGRYGAEKRSKYIVEKLLQGDYKNDSEMRSLMREAKELEQRLKN